MVGGAFAVALFVGVRLWFVDGLLRRVVIDGPSMAPAFCGAHYEIKCDDCAFVFACDAEHVASDSKAACPNCGFAENLLADARLLPAERVLIDHWPLMRRAPRRGQVVALEAPGGDLAVKRIAGLPGEQISIRDGDLFIDGEIHRKTPDEFRSVRVLVHDNNCRPQKTKALPPRWRKSSSSQWHPVDGSFVLEPHTFGLLNSERLYYENWACTANHQLRGAATPISDNDPYNQGELRRPLNAVHDVSLTFRVRSLSALRATNDSFSDLVLRVRDGAQEYWVAISKGRAKLIADRKTVSDVPTDTTQFEKGCRIECGVWDRQLFLVMEGKTVIRHEYERPTMGAEMAFISNEPEFQLGIEAVGISLEINDLKVWRDIYYLDPQGLSRDWQMDCPLGPNEYALLGDNQPVSVDSRQWEPGAVKRNAILGLVRKR